jgi:hypothetical protein
LIVKKVLLLIVVVVAVFILVYRQRLFLRDPLANVTRDGVKESGAQIFINYSNDVLVENDNAPGYVLIVQHGQHIGAPLRLTCVHWMACMTDADAATLSQPMDAQVNEMSGKLVEFRDAAGHDTRVTLR